MALILFTVAVGASFSLAQEANPAPPPQAPPAVQPAGDLPQIPVIKPEAAPAASATDPFAQTVVPASSPAVVEPAATSKTITTTGKHAAKKPRSKPVEEPVVDVTTAAQTAAPAASLAAVEPPANPPPAAPIAASKPAPALKPAGDPVSPETRSDRTMGLGGWVLFGIGIVILFGGITLFRRRRATVRHRSITDFSPTTAEVKLQPALARRP
jgi:cytoskeletal protein RodZ